MEIGFSADDVKNLSPEEISILEQKLSMSPDEKQRRLTSLLESEYEKAKAQAKYAVLGVSDQDLNKLGPEEIAWLDERLSMSDAEHSQRIVNSIEGAMAKIEGKDRPGE